MTDQPAAPFDVERWRKRVTSGEPSWDALCVGMLAACDRIDYLEDLLVGAPDELSCERRRTEAAEARAEGWKASHMRQFVARKKAEAANAALREAAVQLTRALDRHGDVHSSWSGLTSLDKLVEVLQRPSPGAKLLDELEQARKKGEQLCCELGNVMMGRDRLAARNEKLMRIIALYDTRRSRKLGCTSVDGHGMSGYCDCHNKELETALRACDEETK